MRNKIFFHYMLLVIIGIAVTSFFTSKLAQNYYKYEVEEKLKTTALIIQAHIEDELSSGSAIDYDAIAKRYSSVLSRAENAKASAASHMRITFIDVRGNVVGESDTDKQEMENHLGRKEVQEAIKGNFGSDIRFSSTLKLHLLYIAVPLHSENIIVRVSVPLLQINSINEMIWIYTILGISFGIILTALLAYRFSAFIINPIKELINISTEISIGNYSRRVSLKAGNELGQLARAFNDMALKLEKTMTEMIDKSLKVDSIIESMPSGIVAVDTEHKVILINSIACETFGIKNGPGVIGMDIIELIRNNQVNSLLKECIENNTSKVDEIIIGAPQDKILRIYTNPIKSKDHSSPNSGGLLYIHDITTIRKLEQIRTEFVSNVTHELKTPLTSIRGFIETLRNGAINDKEVAERFMEIIDIEAERLYTLINDILHLSEIESKQGDVNISVYNLKPIIVEVFSILEGTAEKRGITLSCEAADDLKIVANRNRIKQMLINLVDNGIKYNMENGTVTVAAERAEGRIILSVKDTGIGIREEHISRIFERFYRVDKGRSRNMGGTGLGLSIVKHIVNLCNGDIKVKSQPGAGTEFIISLPFSSPTNS